MEKKGALELDDDGDDDDVEGVVGSEEIDVDGEDVEDEATMDVLGNGGTRSLGLGLPCLQGKVRNLVSTTASP